MAKPGHAGQGCFTSDKARRTKKAPAADGVLEADVRYSQVENDLAENSKRYPLRRNSRDYVFLRRTWRSTLVHNAAE